MRFLADASLPVQQACAPLMRQQSLPNLTDFPDGHRQVLPFASDTRPFNEGGQRWYHLYRDEEIRHDNILHWTGRCLSWN